MPDLRRWVDAHLATLRPLPSRPRVPAGRIVTAEIAASEEAPTLTGHTGQVWSVAWAVTGDGRLLLATGSSDRTARVWDPHTGTTVATLTGHTDWVWSVAWAVTGDGRLLLATGSSDRTARVWDPHTGTTVATLTGHTGQVWSVAWAATGDGRLLLATGSDDGTARVWDPHTGTTVATLTGHTGWVLSVAWAVTGDGRLLLATGSDDRTARVWDPHTGTTVATLTGHTGQVWSVAWAATGDGRLLLATGSDDRTARVWDPHTGTTVATLTGHTGQVWSVAWAATGDGRLLLATGSNDGTVSLHDVVDLTPTPLVPASVAPGSLATGVVGEAASTESLEAAVAAVVALGRRDLWPPLGLVADLLTLTGPKPGEGLNDPDLAELGSHPTFRRFRDLQWPAAARAAAAALVTAQYPHAAVYALPSTRLGEAEPVLREGLRASTRRSPARTAAPVMGVADVRAALAAVPARALDLMGILGPQALAADPTLALRLSTCADRLPQLPADALAMLGRVSSEGSRPSHREDLTAPRVATPGNGHDGTPLLLRHGPPHRLLPSQLALPDLPRQALEIGQALLYRTPAGPPPPAPVPLTLLLDVSPATFGPVETVLRLLAHLIVAGSWQAGTDPLLLTTAPLATTIEVTRPAQLAQLWTARSLTPPDLPRSVAEAQLSDRPVILLTHRQTALAQQITGSGHDRLTVVTTQTPGTAATPVPTHPRHHHVPARPAAEELAGLAATLLADSGRLVPGAGR